MQEKKEELILEENQAKRWLVPMDNSHNSECALNFTLDRMDKENDIIFLITAVEEETPRAFMYGAVIALEVMQEIQKQKELAGRSLLYKHTKFLKEHGVKHIRLLMSVTNEVGDLICHAVDKHNIDFCCIGRRGLGKLKRLFVGSVSSYIVSHANCNVFVVKGEHGPEEIHEITEKTVKSLEELERIRRIHDEEEQLKSEEERRNFESHINKNITIIEEEKERRRRIEEEKKLEQQENNERNQIKAQVLQEEEKERQRRMHEEHKIMEQEFKIELLNHTDRKSVV